MGLQGTEVSHPMSLNHLFQDNLYGPLLFCTPLYARINYNLFLSSHIFLPYSLTQTAHAHMPCLRWSLPAPLFYSGWCSLRASTQTAVFGGAGGAGAVFSVLRPVHLLFTLLAWPEVSCSIKPLGQFQVSLIPPFADTCLRL